LNVFSNNDEIHRPHLFTPFLRISYARISTISARTSMASIGPLSGKLDPKNLKSVGIPNFGGDTWNVENNTNDGININQIMRPP